ncbi:hypothetical protein [Photobacterium chitinilyticum]|uniref:hypothetical protein n=1 Tax=Photobacterium chitinilyticum TaxID=2485123 RepID=UPI0013E8D592|nr:hypothetical protein [Photobacterium chitinilyticum]
MQHRITTLLSCESAGAFLCLLVWCSSQASPYQVVMQVGLAQIVESKSQLVEREFAACMSQIHHAWKDFRPSMIVLMDGVA